MNERWQCWRDPTHEVGDHPVFSWPQCRVCRAAPAYHERVVPEDLELGVYVLRDDAPAAVLIAPGSGVVGLPAGERVSVYYEGWTHGAAQYENRDQRGRWEAGVWHAADRMVTEYPTSAQASLRPEDLLRVGSYNPSRRQLLIDDERTLTSWLAEP